MRNSTKKTTAYRRVGTRVDTNCDTDVLGCGFGDLDLMFEAIVAMMGSLEPLQCDVCSHPAENIGTDAMANVQVVCRLLNLKEGSRSNTGFLEKTRRFVRLADLSEFDSGMTSGDRQSKKLSQCFEEASGRLRPAGGKGRL